MDTPKDTGWYVAFMGMVGTGVTWFFSHFATTREMGEVKKQLSAHIEQYNKDRLVTQQIHDVFVREGKIKI